MSLAKILVTFCRPFFTDKAPFETTTYIDDDVDDDDGVPFCSGCGTYALALQSQPEALQYREVPNLPDPRTVSSIQRDP